MTLWGVPIDDHFWPSIYPGMFAGAIIGLALRQSLPPWVTVIAGILGGTLGAILGFVGLTHTGFDDGLFPLVLLIAAAVVVAFAVTKALTVLLRPSRP